MLTISGIHRVRVAALCTGVLFGISGAAFAQSKTYEGDVVAVNATAMTYGAKDAPYVVVSSYRWTASTRARGNCRSRAASSTSTTQRAPSR